MMVTLAEGDYRRMVEHAAAVWPEEACGLLAGEEADGVRTVRRVYLLENTDHSREHFSMDPREQLAAVKDMRTRGLRPLGSWHSHPDTPSRPSPEDIRLAYDPSASYLILSLQSRRAPNLNAFRIREGRCEWEVLAIRETEEKQEEP